MLTPRHKGRGRWVVVDGDREVAGPFQDKDAAIAHIEAQPEALETVAPEIGAAAARKAAQRQAILDNRQDDLARRDYQRDLGRSLASTREAFLADLLAVVCTHAGEDAAARCEAELRAIAADPKREAKRRMRLREVQKHGQQPPAQTLTRVAAA